MVPISQSIRGLLEGQGDGFRVWMGSRGPLTRSGIKLAFQRLFHRAGIGSRKADPHCLRHTFATSYISAGGNLWALREIMGHTRLATTQIYVTLARTQVHADHARYSPVATMDLIRDQGEKRPNWPSHVHASSANVVPEDALTSGPTSVKSRQLFALMCALLPRFVNIRGAVDDEPFTGILEVRRAWISHDLCRDE